MIETKKLFEMVEVAEVAYRNFINMATLVPTRGSACNRRSITSRRRASG